MHPLTTLEDLLIATRLPSFTKRAKCKLVAGDKFYFFDTGVYRTIRPTGPFDQPEFIGGISLEIKSKKHISSRDLRELKTFLANYPQAKGCVIYRGEMKQYHDNIDVWPAKQALEELPEILKNDVS